MNVFLNISPHRSGTTSFYHMMKDHPQVRTGTKKEPLYEGYSLSKIEHYLSHWNYNSFCEEKETNVILDASPRLEYVSDSLKLKELLSPYVDEFRYILLVRDPKKYFISKLFIDYFINIVNFPDCLDENHQLIWGDMPFINADYNKLIRLSDVEKGLDFTVKKNEWRDLDTILYSKILTRGNKIFDKNETMIIPIEFFSEYNNAIAKFLKLDSFELEFPNLNEALNLLRNKFIKQKYYIKIIKLLKVITKRVNESETLNNIIINDLQEIDSLYDTNLYDRYY